MRPLLLFILLVTWSLPGLSLPTVADGASLSTPDKDRLARRRRRPRKKPKTKTKAPEPEKAAPEEPAPAEEPAADEPADAPVDDGGAPALTRRGPARIDFDERLIKGQTNKANAIYLFERRSSSLRTLVKKRENFHQEIDDSLR